MEDTTCWSFRTSLDGPLALSSSSAPRMKKEQGLPDAKQSVVHPERLQGVEKACQAWRNGEEFKPLRLGVRKKMVIVTCMDSRLPVEKMFGLKVGDAEVIRNAGGRVTADVLRSLLLCTDLLDCNEIVIVHHTDCGGQAAVREHDKLVKRMYAHMSSSPWLPLSLVTTVGWYLSFALPGFLRRMVSDRVLLPIRDLYQSLDQDISSLRFSPLFPEHIKVRGFLYHTETGELEAVQGRNQ